MKCLCSHLQNCCILCSLLYFESYSCLPLPMFDESQCRSRRFKGTVNVNSASDPLFLEWHVQFITVFFKVSIDKGYRTYSS